MAFIFFAVIEFLIIVLHIKLHIHTGITKTNKDNTENKSIIF